MSWLFQYIPGSSYLFGDSTQAAAATAYQGLNNAAAAAAANQTLKNARAAAAAVPIQSKANRIRAQIAAGINHSLTMPKNIPSDSLAGHYIYLAREAKKEKNAANIASKQGGGKRKTKRRGRGRK
jgi:hypothetical protein